MPDCRRFSARETDQSLAKAFDPEGKLSYHDETIKRMYAIGKRRADQTEEQQQARKRMALFPTEHSEVLFVREDMWVPVVRLKGKLCIFPGIPRLFEGLLTAYMSGGYLPLPPASEKPCARFFSRFRPNFLLPL